jgi:hypothetical protein
MLASAVASVLLRDLKSLRRQVEEYPEESQLWAVAPGITNSGGTLVLHLAGAVQHFIGKHLAGTSYRRDRAAEFARRDVSRAELLAEIDAAEKAVGRLRPIDDAALRKDFPEAVGGSIVQTGEFLVHLATHLTYHLGQLDYHRRFVTGQNTPVPSLRPAELATARPL